MGYGQRRNVGMNSVSEAQPIAGLTSVKIGVQGTALAVLDQQKPGLGAILKRQNIEVDWLTFANIAAVIEVMNAGHVHLGWTIAAPPIFGQLAGASIVYVAVVPQDRSLRTGLSYLLANRDFASENADIIARTVASLQPPLGWVWN